MTREPHRPGAGVLLLGLVSAAGALLGLLLEATLWMLEQPGRGLPEGAQRFMSAFGSTEPRALLFALSGAAAWFVATGYVRGTFRNVGAHVRMVLVLGVGGMVGAWGGASAFVAAWGRQYAQVPLAEAFRRAPEAVREFPEVFVLFTIVGVSLGITLGALVSRSPSVDRLAGALIGLALGATAGVVLYTVSSLLLEPVLDWTWPELTTLLGRTVTSAAPLEIVFAGFGAVVGMLVARNRWQFYGIVTFMSLLAVVGGFGLYSVYATLPRVEPEFRWFAWLLFSAEALSLAMVLLYSYYSIDVTSRKEWRRGPLNRPHSVHYLPRVAFQVPCFNEPPPLVVETLEALQRVDYPADRYLIMVLDDSTDPESAQPLEAYCRRHGLTYLHRTDRSGYKAGALNHALRFTPQDVDVIAVVDADYLVRPEYLRETVGYLVDEDLAWVQTPQDYRNPDQSFLTQQYHLADAYFYRTVMPSRNEENTIIFAGTMGLVRRQALEEVGSWGERYITEDAELSLRLLLHGYTSIYVNKTYGKGLIPATFEGYKKQHYRWAFGGGKILAGHLHHLLFGRLTRRQAFDYFVSTVHWFEGHLIFLIALLLMTLAGAEVMGLRVATHHGQEVLLVGLIPFFVLADGLTRLHTVLRSSLRLSPLHTVRILGMWFAVKFSNARAATKGFLGFHQPFVRTPKAPTERISAPEALWQALRVARFESIMAGLLLALGVALMVSAEQRSGGIPAPVWFLGFWTFYYFAVFVSAPLYAYLSYITFRPDAAAGVTTHARPPQGLAGAGST